MLEEKQVCWLQDVCNHIDCGSFCMRNYKLSYLYDEALISVAKRKHIGLVYDKDGTDLEEFKRLKAIETNIVDFISEGKQLYIHSAIAGNGKSSWALRMVEAYFNKIWMTTDLTCKALFISVPQFLLAIKDNITEKSNYVQKIKSDVLEADLVIWDDIATKVTTPFESENLLSIIDNRINSGKSNIFTSNLNNEELHKALGDRLASRICNLSYNIELHGADKRGIMNIKTV